MYSAVSWDRRQPASSASSTPLDKKFTACLKMLTKHNPKGLDAFISLTDFSKILNTHKL
jgi:hypothetical protein